MSFASTGLDLLSDMIPTMISLKKLNYGPRAGGADGTNEFEDVREESPLLIHLLEFSQFTFSVLTDEG